MSEVQQLFERFHGKKILVIGDVMIDAYVRGKVNRVSPEAPVPIVSLEKQEDRLGGAANVAVNLVALGAAPIICSVVGNDKQANDLKELLQSSEISSDGLIFSETRQTTVKTRVIGNNQQLLRIDSEQTNPISKVEEDELLLKIKDLLESGIDGIIFEDYNKGVLTPAVIEEVIRQATAANVITAVDPKKENFLAYKGVSLFKPNLKELREGLNLNFSFSPNNKLDFEKAVLELEKQLENHISFVTLSEYGVFIKSEQNTHYAAAHLRNIADVSGAGDTVIAVATLCLICGAKLELVAELANIAGGLVCEKSGVVSIDREQLMNEAKRLIN
jgi:rfaE bifunctional protein kinase chain/domain